MEEAPSPYRLVMVPLLYSPAFVEAFFIITFGVMLPVLRKELNFGPAAAGWLGSAAWVTPAFLAIPGALIAVRIRPKLMFTFTSLMVPLAGLMQTLAPNFLFLFLGRLASSAVNPLTRPVVDLFILQWIPRRELGRVVSVGPAFNTIAQSLALWSTPLIMLALGSWRGAYLLFTIAGAFVLLLWVLLGRERRSARYEQSMNQAKGKPPLGAFFKYPFFLVGGVAFIGNAFPWLAMLIFWPSYLVEVRHLSLTTTGSLTALVPLGGFLSVMAVGFLSDKVGRRKPFMWFFWLVAPAVYFSMLLPVPVPLLALSALGMGFVAWGPTVPFQMIPFELPGITPAEVAVGRSLTSTIVTSGNAVAPVMVGTLWAAFGLHNALLAALVLPWLALLLMPLIPETGRRKQSRPAPEGNR